MAYKKAPSIKHQEKQIKARIGRELLTKERFDEFVASMPTEDREKFNKALAAAIKKHQE